MWRLTMINNFSIDMDYYADEKILYIEQCEYFNIKTKEDLLKAFDEFIENYYTLLEGDNDGE